MATATEHNDIETDETEPDETEPDETMTEDTSAEPADSSASASASGNPRTLSIRLSTALTALLVVALAVATALFAYLYSSAESSLSQRDVAAADDHHAEDVATNYALGASTIDYHDIDGWVTRLKTDTNATLAAKFDSTAPQLQQIILPLQWTSKATPLSATVISESDGIYKVNAYLNVDSTSVQSPGGAQTTVTYSVTIDRNSGWKITDVGGLQTAIPTK